VVTDSSTEANEIAIDFFVAPPSKAIITAPTPGQVFPDTDLKPGENVVLDATNSVQGDCNSPGIPPCGQPTYQWTINGQVTSTTSLKTTVHLPDGTSTISLVVSNAAQTSLATAPITVTVSAPPVPTAVIAGGNRTITNTTGQPTVSVPMDGSGSTAVDPASIASYTW